MGANNTLNRIVGWVLTSAAVVFVLLLAGVASDALTDDPPVVSPYATGSDDKAGDTSPPTTSAPPEPNDTTAATGTAITISGFAFGDPTSGVVGGEVTVTNTDGASHTWTSRDGVFDSGSIASGDSFSFVFDAPGDYDFFCSIHPSMTGAISVTG